MTKRYLLLISLLVCVCSLHAQITETATEAVKNMGLGWNLGNTLDANGNTTTDVTSDSYWGGQTFDSEISWGQPKTTEDLIKMMKNAGFGAIRVPVTWYNHMDKNGYVDTEWMGRVKEVVNYIINNGLYCILNVHHDTGADSNTFHSWIKADETNYNDNKKRYENLWNQIATTFCDYDEHLLFEAYNEMLDTESSWCFASFNADPVNHSTYDAALATSAYNGLNSYGQSFVNTVRATGHNNATRNLIVNTYAAATGYGSWSSHLNEVLTKKTLPDDTTTGHLIFEVHDYPSIATTNNNVTTNRTIADIKAEVDGTIKNLNENLVSKGAPVIIGEWGTSNVDAGSGKTDYDVRRDLMKQFCEYFVQKCKENNIATFYWMGLTDGTYRSIPSFNQADLAECLAKAYHGSDYEGEYPSGSTATSITAYEGEKVLAWGDGITIPASSFEMVGYPMTLTLTYKQTNSYGADIQLYYGDWSVKPSFTVEGKTYEGDVNPYSVYKTTANTDHTTDITFDETTFGTLTSKGLIIHGNGITLYKAVLTSGTTGIETVIADDSIADDAIYNIAGQRITKPAHGLYIKGGKKYLAK